ncbi:MAG TPA: gamma-glutamyltransferase [Spirillospora sp.]|nr:gamma-glutamyltransferase [Spirillospora sp.]
MNSATFDFNSRRALVMARRGMVAASNPLAAQAGLNILRQGGNAADAAVAASAVMNVTEPGACGIGGDCFALFFDAQTKRVSALNGSGRAPQALRLEDLRAQGWTQMDPFHAHAVTVPGAVRGWHDLLERYGTMTLADVLVDAIHYADEGYPLAPTFGYGWRNNESFLRRAVNADEYLPDGKPPQPGQVIQLRSLAKTLRLIAEGGPDAFYTGPVAETIVTTLQEQGGVMTLDDLKNHYSTWDEPILTNYRGVTVYECPPNGQGLAALQAMNIASTFELRSLAWDSPERLHLMIESMRLAWADARQYIADMSRSHVPVDELLSQSYAEQRAALISPERTMTPPAAYGKLPLGSDTIYLCVVDGAGNACSFIKSLYMGFGVGIVAKGTGVWLQNRGAGFVLEPGHANALEGGKRPYHTIIPGMALRDGEFWACFGVMGGFMQPQGHLQVMSAMLDDDLNPQEALNRPRWYILDGKPDGEVLLEEGIPVSTMARLAEMGHKVRPVSGWGRRVFGRGQIIRRDPYTGVLFGGSEPRADGLAAAF